jgi:hypothetical protein
MRARAAAGLLASAGATALLWLLTGTQATLPELHGVARGWSGDFVAYYLPNAEYAGARFAKGELPLWNPHQSAGSPLLATLQVGALYPPNWLHAALPTQTAFLVLATFHVALAALLAGALARALGAGGWGAAVAGLAYASSLQVVATIWSPPTHYAAAWAPGLLLAVDRVIARPEPRRAVGLAVAAAMSLLSGWPYTFAMLALAASVYAGVVFAAQALRTRRIPWRGALALVIGVAGGLMLAAPQLLPAAELVERSCRALGSLVEAQAVFVGKPHNPAVFRASLLRDGLNDGVPGAISLLLAVLALALPGPGRGRVATLLGVGVLALATSFPQHAPIYGWLRELPVLGDFRFPYKYRLLSTLVLAVAAGVGTAHLQHVLRRWPRAAFGVGAMTLAACLVTAALPVFQGVLPFARSAPERPSLVRELAAAGAPERGRGLGRIYWAGRTERLRDWADIYALHDLEPLTLARSGQMLTYFETGRARTVLTLENALAGGPSGDTVAAPFYGLLVLPKTGDRAAILDLFSARTIVTETPYPWLAERYRRLSPPDAPIAVFDNPHALPRAYRAARALPEPPSLQAGLRKLVAKAFDPRRFVLLDQPPPDLLARPRVRPRLPTGEVEIVALEPERVVLRTRGGEPAIVVLTDAYFPGWAATVDGEPAPLLRANLNFRAVPVPAGEHEIEMRYRPASLRWGLALALVAALGCVAAWWRSGSARLRAGRLSPGGVLSSGRVG